jgi:hypothetical protein
MTDDAKVSPGLSDAVAQLLAQPVPRGMSEAEQKARFNSAVKHDAGVLCFGRMLVAAGVDFIDGVGVSELPPFTFTYSRRRAVDALAREMPHDLCLRLDGAPAQVKVYAYRSKEAVDGSLYRAGYYLAFSGDGADIGYLQVMMGTQTLSPALRVLNFCMPFDTRQMGGVRLVKEVLGAIKTLIGERDG